MAAKFHGAAIMRACEPRRPSTCIDGSTRIAHLLKPPVGNKLLFQDSDFIVMAVGGPNSRKDFHHDPSEEFFFQVEGDMVLKTVQDGRLTDVPIREGEVFLLPARSAAFAAAPGRTASASWSNGAAVRMNWTAFPGTAKTAATACIWNGLPCAISKRSCRKFLRGSIRTLRIAPAVPAAPSCRLRAVTRERAPDAADALARDAGDPLARLRRGVPSPVRCRRPEAGLPLRPLARGCSPDPRRNMSNRNWRTGGGWACSVTTRRGRPWIGYHEAGGRAARRPGRCARQPKSSP